MTTWGLNSFSWLFASTAHRWPVSCQADCLNYSYIPQSCWTYHAAIAINLFENILPGKKSSWAMKQELSVVASHMTTAWACRQLDGCPPDIQEEVHMTISSHRVRPVSAPLFCFCSVPLMSHFLVWTLPILKCVPCPAVRSEWRQLVWGSASSAARGWWSQRAATGCRAGAAASCVTSAERPSPGTTTSANTHALLALLAATAANAPSGPTPR